MTTTSPDRVLTRQGLDRTAHLLRTVQAQALAGVEEPLDRLYVGTRASVQHVAQHGAVSFRLHAADPSFARELGESSRLHADDALAVVGFGQARPDQADGSVRADETPEAPAGAVQGVAGAAAVAWLRGRSPSLEDAADAAARFVVRAVASGSDLADEVIARRG